MSHCIYLDSSKYIQVIKMLLISAQFLKNKIKVKKNSEIGMKWNKTCRGQRERQVLVSLCNGCEFCYWISLQLLLFFGYFVFYLPGCNTTCTGNN